MAIAWLLATTAQQRDRNEFEKHTLTAENLITDRIETSIALLRGAAGLFSSTNDTVTMKSFRAYIERLALRERYAGLLGIGFSLRLPESEKVELENKIRSEGQAGFRVWPETASEGLHTIVYLEPLDARNQAAIGYNMYSDDIRRAAMSRARDTGTASASAIVVLKQEIDEKKQPGFLIYLPVYRDGHTPETLAERRRLLLGFVYSPIRAVDFLSKAFTHEPVPTVSLYVYHGTPPDEDSLIYRRLAPHVPDKPQFTKTAVITATSEPWTLRFESDSSQAEAVVMPGLTLLAGLVLSALLASLVWREAGARTEIERLLDSEHSARAEAERANLIKDHFLATLSHELRTPLNAILGWAQVMALPNVTAENLKKGVDAISRNSKAQAHLIDELLDMSRVVSGKLRMEIQAVDLPVLLAASIEGVSPAAEAKGVIIRTRIDPSIGVIQADPARLQQVMWNLLSNAIKFTPGLGVVEVSARPEDGHIEIAVKDSGAGIDPQFLPHVFDRFAQADSTTTRHHGGLGLGLAIVRHIIELHGGQVRAISAGADKGATFVLRLPVAAAARAEPLTGPDKTKVAAPLPGTDLPADFDFEGVTVLVVDDEPDARELVRMLLNNYKARVLMADSSGAAFEMFKRERPEILLSDIAMPEMDGYELIRKIREYEREQGGRIGAVAFTAFARPEDRADALHDGFQEHLVKPFDASDLINLVSRLLNSSTRGAGAG